MTSGKLEQPAAEFSVMFDAACFLLRFSGMLPSDLAKSVKPFLRSIIEFSADKKIAHVRFDVDAILSGCDV